MQNISVAIIDDHPLFRDGVACSLSESGIFSVLAQGGSSDEAIRIARDTRPDILLLDLSMPGGGLQAIAAVRRLVPGQNIVVLTVSEAGDDVLMALREGWTAIFSRELARRICWMPLSASPPVKDTCRRCFQHACWQISPHASIGSPPIRWHNLPVASARCWTWLPTG